VSFFFFTPIRLLFSSYKSRQLTNLYRFLLNTYKCAKSTRVINFTIKFLTLPTCIIQELNQLHSTISAVKKCWSHPANQCYTLQSSTGFSSTGRYYKENFYTTLPYLEFLAINHNSNLPRQKKPGFHTLSFIQQLTKDLQKHDKRKPTSFSRLLRPASRLRIVPASVRSLVQPCK
jgi:hypothetical protein